MFTLCYGWAHCLRRSPRQRASFLCHFWFPLSCWVLYSHATAARPDLQRRTYERSQLLPAMVSRQRILRTYVLGRSRLSRGAPSSVRAVPSTTATMILLKILLFFSSLRSIVSQVTTGLGPHGCYTDSGVSILPACDAINSTVRSCFADPKATASIESCFCKQDALNLIVG